MTALVYHDFGDGTVLVEFEGHGVPGGKKRAHTWHSRKTPWHPSRITEYEAYMKSTVPAREQHPISSCYTTPGLTKKTKTPAPGVCSRVLHARVPG